MKPSAIRKFRAVLAADRPVFGLWVTLEAPSITEMAVGLDVDWIVIDAEHGHLDWKEICEHIRAAVRSDTVVLVRIAEVGIGLVKRALDLGADGVVVPWIESVEQLRQALAFARFPPEGVRGIGAERATCWGQSFVEHAGEANEHVLVVPIIESVRGGKNLAELLKVAGTELFFIGPADYSSSAGYRGQWEGPGVAEELLALKDAVRAAGKNCGVIATGNENLQLRVQQGFRMLGLGVDTGFLLRSLHGALAAVDRDQTLRAGLAPEKISPNNALPATAPLSRPPETFRPDRRETMTVVGQNSKIELARGVQFECLVGQFNSARNLTTGLVTISPGANLDYHTHEFAEGITLLSGALEFEVEGRRYSLSALDNITIPRGLAHAALNSSEESSVLHVALASDTPERTLVERDFSPRVMPDESTGMPGAERVTRSRTAPRFDLGAGTSFIDFFNADLMPGLEMSGGYGLFQPGGRLPAHVHDFDESICIMSGLAVCVVEGQRYELANCATAHVPRGRVHYFSNETDSPMAMIWVYAGPLPERIVVAEACCTREGNPWK
jgi:2-dehydro-3-deoxyglucarate aldolase/4-hydroxy-2-oxoheptanedioate aldolase